MIRSVEKFLGWLLFAVVVLAVGALQPAHAQATRFSAVSITCPATGTSIQVLAASASRESFIVLNTSGATVRVAGLATGTVALTDSNSVKLLAGQNFSDSAPSIYIGRLTCMSDDATPDVVYVIETKRQ
jgi:hypothetical protein